MRVSAGVRRILAFLTLGVLGLAPLVKVSAQSLVAGPGHATALVPELQGSRPDPRRR